MKTSESIKAAADAAERRSKGEPIDTPRVEIDPVAARPTRRGRYSKYSPALDRAICKMLASGLSLNQICKRKHMPNERTVRTWASDPKHPFSPNYDRARKAAYLGMAEQILDIADDGVNDYVERKRDDGSTFVVADSEHIARSRLRVDTRKWVLSKMLPKVYGEKLPVELSGKDGKPIEIVSDVSETEAARRVAYMLGSAMVRLAAQKNAELPET